MPEKKHKEQNLKRECLKMSSLSLLTFKAALLIVIWRGKYKIPLAFLHYRRHKIHTFIALKVDRIS